LRATNLNHDETIEYGANIELDIDKYHKGLRILASNRCRSIYLNLPNGLLSLCSGDRTLAD